MSVRSVRSVLGIDAPLSSMFNAVPQGRGGICPSQKQCRETKVSISRESITKKTAGVEKGLGIKKKRKHCIKYEPTKFSLRRSSHGIQPLLFGFELPGLSLAPFLLLFVLLVVVVVVVVVVVGRRRGGGLLASFHSVFPFVRAAMTMFVGFVVSFSNFDGARHVHGDFLPFQFQFLFQHDASAVLRLCSKTLSFVFVHFVLVVIKIDRIFVRGSGGLVLPNGMFETAVVGRGGVQPRRAGQELIPLF